MPTRLSSTAWTASRPWAVCACRTSEAAVRTLGLTGCSSSTHTRPSRLKGSASHTLLLAGGAGRPTAAPVVVEAAESPEEVRPSGEPRQGAAMRAVMTEDVDTLARMRMQGSRTDSAMLGLEGAAANASEASSTTSSTTLHSSEPPAPSAPWKRSASLESSSSSAAEAVARLAAWWCRTAASTPCRTRAHMSATLPCAPLAAQRTRSRVAAVRVAGLAA
mmetsp:Transcript_38190/g.96715  ORF Transcript_38190/g.96715 Transcript_38190/m.96715 type:complete len:219 (-) Transcript_38190:384-1040(-)